MRKPCLPKYQWEEQLMSSGLIIKTYTYVMCQHKRVWLISQSGINDWGFDAQDEIEDAAEHLGHLGIAMERGIKARKSRDKVISCDPVAA